MKNNKEKLLQDLFAAIEERKVAEVEEVIARRDLDKVIAKGNKAEILEMVAIRIDKATNLAIAEMRADEAYKAYIASIKAQRQEAAAND